MSGNDLSYYEKRAREEADAARKAISEVAASAHQLLALEYEAHARDLRRQAEEMAQSS